MNPQRGPSGSDRRGQRRHAFPRLLTCAFLLALAHGSASLAAPREFTFGILAHAAQGPDPEQALRTAIADTDDENHAFVVASGLKTDKEPCNDALYERRAEVLKSAKNGIVPSLAAHDWSACTTDGAAPSPSSAIGRLARLRDLLYADDFSLGGSRIPVVRQSSNVKFRAYAENMRWEIEGIMFATVNLPANNNNFVADAGRNSEFEDRLVANRDWLRRVFLHAAKMKARGIVLFCDGNPLAVQANVRRDGFTEIRRQLLGLAKEFEGRILVAHGQAPDGAKPAGTIAWKGNLGELAAYEGIFRLAAGGTSPGIFRLVTDLPQATIRP
ncbi:hypothetical protein [Noviherbaspirillum galbum]|uniref:Uncharacterized protein n=1 Tax=Noviherbaspirillum galbum TaxID=2709383 RepID=A0A6B3SGA2_9BURK|nr:hypothetical protein [Noviherbaspirillum galbum]NEX59907.1 hypothetical protein [Noviherbaspirillum galbum]